MSYSKCHKYFYVILW